MNPVAYSRAQSAPSRNTPALLPTYEPKGRKPMEKPAVKPRRVVEIQRFIQKPFLENETEVEDFLSKLRSELHDAIAIN